MCGIVGSIGYPESKVKRALNTMVRRGPDDVGLWSHEDVVFGHRRLSILDLTTNGRQPMTDASGQVVITFNGEIYNYQALRNKLAAGYPFRTQTDTEVLIAGYLQWGIDELLQQIRGMFAFAIWDGRTRALILARDPFGKKPLYYAHKGRQLRFASTMNAMLALYNETPGINFCALDDYLTYLSVPGDQTIFHGMQKLLPAHYAVFRDGRMETQRYWYLSFANQLDIVEEEALDEIDRLLHQAVRRRLVSDVPVGAFLSGGVDSSLVTAIMAQESSKPITTLTMGFEDAQFDERPYARQVSERYQTHQCESVLSGDMWPLLPKIVHEFGEPFADSSALPTYCIAQFAKQHVTVVLNGDGGDEMFAGYTRPLVEALAQKYRRMVPQFLRYPLGSYAHAREKLRPRMLNGVKQVLEAGRTDARGAFVFDRALRTHRSALYTPEFQERLRGHHPDHWYQQVWDAADGLTPVDKALYGDAMTYLPDELLPKMDAMTMAHSLEARAPLLDIDIAEFVARLPYPLKVQGLDTKMLLKKLARRYVPDEVLFRPKKGFNMPLASWLRTVLAEPMRQLLLDRKAQERGFFEPVRLQRMMDAHLAGAKDYSQQLWSLLMLELWFRMYIDKDILPTDDLSAFAGVGVGV